MSTILVTIMCGCERFFFPANILSHMDELDEPIENENEFTAIMMVHTRPIITILTSYVADLQAFGQSFLQPDLTIFKKNIEYLESLNTKHKLFSKVSHSIMCN